MSDGPVFTLSPKALAALKASAASMFNPPPDVAKWMEANRPNEAEIMAMLEAYYLREAQTDGGVH